MLSECERLRKEDQPPVLNEEEFATLAKNDPKSDILDAEELQLGEHISYTQCIWQTISLVDWDVMHIGGHFVGRIGQY